ncbi:MAG: lysophospholipid acyltransferase family protein [Motiliproteus sp.]|nr:lysophospholipid acyltransferase family protein [Motiliproteus sp.]MCW9053812.1 lysophospholipid acyltransferase family protein [Motiliproteus sp.]
MLQWLSRFILKQIGWKLDFDLPQASHYLLIGYPHTSNWDFILAMLAKGALKFKFRWLAKDTLFFWPLGILMRAMGGIPVNRRVSTGFTGQLKALYDDSDELVIVITPEGTRSHRDYWKSGFYHLASAAQVPVALGYIDYPGKKLGIGPLIELSGDPSADLKRIKTFYQDKIGRFPEKAGTIQFRQSDGQR